MRWFDIMIALMLVGFASLSGQDYRIIRGRNGKEINMMKMVYQLAKYDIIFFGEFHDNRTLHDLQMEMTRQLKQRRKPLILSFEMFERDVQNILDLYLSGEMSEDDMLLNARPWPNYQTDYRPLVEFAREHNLAVIAANIPRTYAGRVAREGLEFIDDLAPRERAFIADKINTWDDEYKKRFLKTIAITTAHGMPGEASFYEKMYAAQCIKDDTMAESIVNACRSNPKHLIIHFNGDFHSQYYLGTVQRVKYRLPKAKIAVISPLQLADITQFKYDKSLRDKADFIILIPKEAETR
ncbi:MAG: ChaN family lipoprotein [Candidatus Cloacimonetes bacterium]|nr:ChaN family lipoprotein [Candidatus Cloacimonadota bacterium]